jgi:hypothetical protein
MRRATTITLAIMGGGLMTLGVVSAAHEHALNRACEQARAAQRPDPRCDHRTSGGSGGSGGGHFFGNGSSGSSAGTAQATAASARGGFGASGAKAGGS